MDGDEVRGVARERLLARDAAPERLVELDLRLPELGFLFAVFENPGTREQCIYYRGEALLHARGRTVRADFEDIPWDRLPDEATRSMLRRYAAERKIGRFKVYSGDHKQGTVKAVD